jgi:glycosyltransferase involved in cell wall biosynthesis
LALDRPPSEPLRVALVTSSYNFIQDGVALTLNRLVAYLLSQGVEVRVFAPTAGAPDFAHAGDVTSVPSLPLPARPEYRLALGMAGYVKRQLLDFQPDIIHIAVPDLLGHAALTLARKNDIPVVATYHTRYETYLKHYWYLAPLEGLLKAILRRFYGACREVYVPSGSTRDILLADGLRDNFKPWPRGVDTARFSPAKRSAAWRAQHGIGADELVVLHVSRLVREKRLDTLTRALNLLKAPHRVVIVGDGPDRAFASRIAGRHLRRISRGRRPGDRLCLVGHFHLSQRQRKLRQCHAGSDGVGLGLRLRRRHRQPFAGGGGRDRPFGRCQRCAGLC